MRFQAIYCLNRRSVFLAVAAAGLTVLLSLAGAADHPPASDHKVAIAFGFHVNLYHSFRNDTNDESGFGKDIRIIRHIIQTLDQCNAKGIPVKGVWDFDNLFSLQEILPQHAPDIIEDIRRRVHQNGDEVILMSYNNGLVSAMTRQELNVAVRWSITNPWNSGVQDLFGQYTPVVRPQEMMNTPGNFSIYKAHGIQAVALYYSATPFDTFRVFSRQLTRAEAHNPILYRHPKTKEEMVILPTYHFGDLVEHVSLRHWVSELRRLQTDGKLNQDALIFINFDADSELWSGVDLPWIMDWLPNTGGIGDLVNEVKDLPYVKFTTIGDYLAKHPPTSAIAFSQDTADGSFHGYNSWAEKANTARHWTTIERNRRTQNASRKAVKFLNGALDTAQLRNINTIAEMKRLRALSTTNFGMATPFLSRQREKVMADMAHDLDNLSDKTENLLAEGLRRTLAQENDSTSMTGNFRHLDTVLVLQWDREGGPTRRRFIKVPMPDGYSEEMDLFLLSPSGKLLPTVSLGLDPAQPNPPLKLYITGRYDLTDGIYFLCTGKVPRTIQTADQGQVQLDQMGMSNERLAIRFEKGRLEGIYLDGHRQVEPGSLMPQLKWGLHAFDAKATVTAIQPFKGGPSASFQMSGPLLGPSGRTVDQGWMDYTFTLVSEMPYLMINASIRYPLTTKLDVLKAASPGLIRRADMQWQEVAPAEIRFTPTVTRNDPIRIQKENYLGLATDYALDYYHHNDRNLNLDNVNNHITKSYVGLLVGDSGMAVAMDNSVRSNFAFAPIRMQYDRLLGTFSASVNPFGTYHGDQYDPPTWGNGNGFDATLLAGEQFASAGPTYNGVEQAFSLMLAFFKGRSVPDRIRQDMVDFANPPLVISASRRAEAPVPSDPPSPPQGLVAAYNGGAVQFSWDNGRDPHDHFRILCGTAPGRYEAVYAAVGNSLEVGQFIEGQPFASGRTYFATIKRVAANGSVSPQAQEIQFEIQPLKPSVPDLPLKLELRLLWANVQALLNDWHI